MMMLIGTLALTWIPAMTAGYFSKDAIIESCLCGPRQPDYAPSGCW